MSTSDRLKLMSTRASDRLRQAHKQSNIGNTQQVKNQKANLHEILQENEVYEDVLEQINRKLALRQAMDQASEAIERSKQGSEMGSAFGKDNDRSIAASSRRQADVRSKSSNHSKMSSLVALSHKGKCAVKSTGKSNG